MSVTRLILATCIIFLSVPQAWAQSAELPLQVDATAAFGLTEPNQPEVSEAPPVVKPFNKGSWEVHSYFGAIVGDPVGEIYTGNIGIGFYVEDDIAVVFEGVAGGFDGEPVQGHQGGDGFVGGATLMLRHQLIIEPNYSFYIDFGAGLLFFEEPYPASGTHANFSPQAGAGFTLKLSDKLHLMGGARWHHVSNAFRKGDDQNPGADAFMGYVGLLLTF